ncbi:MAG TPA: site-specific integrase [Pyrinomonadaceae bacterium]|nr:site-specific integrase [Pyrinomonadaceae bacterium]
MKYFTQTEVKSFLEAAKTDRYYAAFLLAIETGMRPEEYLGLQWKDVDFDKGVLSVRRVVITLKGGGFYFAEPKTSKSRRSIPLSDTVSTALKVHKRIQLEEKMKLGLDYQNLDLVFASTIGTPVQHRNFDRRHFAVIRDKANLPAIRLYDLRHTTATLLLSAGLNPKVVSERLGHASIVLTLDTYSHVLPTMQQDATDRLGRVLYG